MLRVKKSVVPFVFDPVTKLWAPETGTAEQWGAVVVSFSEAINTDLYTDIRPDGSGAAVALARLRADFPGLVVLRDDPAPETFEERMQASVNAITSATCQGELTPEDNRLVAGIVRASGKHAVA
jgi:hypothetical protein